MGNENTDIITITAKPAIVTANFTEVRAILESELERYKGAVVTIETLAADKKLVAEIRKRGNDIKRVRIDKAKELAAPITEFERQMKELESMCSTVALEIDNQVKAFEQEKLTLCEELLIECLAAERKKQGIRSEFHAFEVDDLIKLGSITPTGRLTASAISAIRLGVHQQELALQQKVDMRLAKLDGESLSAGLDAPLTERHVASFVRVEDDDSYRSTLKLLIDAELDRQEVSRKRQEQQMRQRIEAEEAAKAKAKAEPAAQPQQQSGKLADAIPVEQKQRIEKLFEPIQEKPQAPAGKRVVTVIARFDVTVPEQVEDQRVIDKVTENLIAAGFKTLTSVEVI